MVSAIPAAAATKPVLLNPATLWHDSFGVLGVNLVGYFNADNKADIINFNCGPAGDVFVSLSDGTHFGPAQRWSTSFCGATDIPMVGDFNGDGLDDIVVFTRGMSGDVFVSLSNGVSFGPKIKWHDVFCFGDETPQVGDFNGDGRDDIATFTHPGQGMIGAAYVALSNGRQFVGTAVLWSEFWGSFVPVVGDFDADHKSDVAALTPSGDIWVALSDGSRFVEGDQIWGLTPYDANDFIVPRVKGYWEWAAPLLHADRLGTGDVVALRPTWWGSRPLQRCKVPNDVTSCAPNAFEWPPQIAYSHFSDPGEVVLSADFNGDGLVDLVRFIGATRPAPAMGDVYVALGREATGP
jgi:hypothetical protein